MIARGQCLIAPAAGHHGAAPGAAAGAAGGQRLGTEGEGAARAWGGEEESRALAGLDQPLGGGGGDRLAHDGGADAQGGGALVLGGQPPAAGNAAAGDLGGEPLN